MRLQVPRMCVLDSHTKSVHIVGTWRSRILSILIVCYDTSDEETESERECHFIVCQRSASQPHLFITLFW
jgi:hypothetical protein